MNIIEKISAKFRSGNDIPVSRTMLTRDEWQELLSHIWQLEEERDTNNTDAYDQMTDMRNRIQELETRLEVDPRHKWDGIACRDATIMLLESELKRAQNIYTNIAWAVDWGYDNDRPCATIMAKRHDGVLQVLVSEYAPDGYKVR